jgi:hypothetical protein
LSDLLFLREFLLPVIDIGQIFLEEDGRKRYIFLSLGNICQQTSIFVEIITFDVY